MYLQGSRCFDDSTRSSTYLERCYSSRDCGWFFRASAPLSRNAIGWCDCFDECCRSRTGSEGKKFLVKEEGRWNATPLLLALVAVEAMDIIFAIDSVPAVLAINAGCFYCIFLECVCHSWAPRHVFRAGGLVVSLPFSPCRARSNPRFCGRQDVRRWTNRSPHRSIARNYRWDYGSDCLRLVDVAQDDEKPALARDLH